MSEITFVICTEQGVLEPMSVTLVKSLRRFGGRFKDATVVSYQPRTSYEVSKETRDTLADLGVEHITEPLNKKYAFYPQGNKPYVCCHAEQNTATEYLAFLDSDIVILQEPKLLLLPSNKDVGLRPVDKKGVGTIGEGDRNYSYWKKLYELLSVDAEEITRIKTTVDQIHIYPYWNSGVVCVRREAGLFTQWCYNFEAVMSSNLRLRQGIFHTDQTTLAATLSQQNTQIEVLPSSYNYPLHLHNEIAGSNRVDTLQDIILLHYHKIFHKNDSLPLLKRLSNSERVAWVLDQIDYITSVQPEDKPDNTSWYKSAVDKIKSVIR